MKSRILAIVILVAMAAMTMASVSHATGEPAPHTSAAALTSIATTEYSDVHAAECCAAGSKSGETRGEILLDSSVAETVTTPGSLLLAGSALIAIGLVMKRMQRKA